LTDLKHNESAFSRACERAAWLHRIRPSVIAQPALRFLGRRMIIEREGLRLFVDPTSNLGWMIHRYGTYEALTVEIFRRHVREGDIVLDIGANEGFFSALASVLAGPNGRVIAVEPQSRLQDVLAINLALNRTGPTEVIQGVVTEADGEQAEINLFPSSNTGASSLVRHARLGSKTERVGTWTPEAIADQCGIDRFDFVKIDVEGFEPEVIRAFEPLLARGAVRTILLDYHTKFLAERGIDPTATHELVLSHGYMQEDGDHRSEYVVYQRAGEGPRESGQRSTARTESGE
jgi:FkbM family methyltransferase